MRFIFAALIALATPAAWAGNYATCILDKMPGVKNGPAYAAVVSLCAQQHPDAYYSIRRGDGLGVLGPKSADACTADKARDTSWQAAAGQILRACSCLYSPGTGKFDMCDRYNLPSDLAAQYDMTKPEMAYKVETHYRNLSKIHPDWYEIMSAEVFWPWIHASKDRERTLLQGSTDQVARLYDRYKADRAQRGLSTTSNRATFTYDQAIGR